MNTLFVLTLLLVAIGLVPVANSVVGYLDFKPEKNAQVAANQFLPVNGTSIPSNATYTKCNVQFQTNQKGYQAVTPTGPGTANYTTWSTTTSEMVHKGNNTLEAKLECFPPSALGNQTAPNFAHYLVHNITGI